MQPLLNTNHVDIVGGYTQQASWNTFFLHIEKGKLGHLLEKGLNTILSHKHA